MIHRFAFLLACAALLCQFGCVGSGTYHKKVEETSSLKKDLSDLQRGNMELARDNEELRSELARLRARADELEAGNKNLERMLADKSEPSYMMVAELERDKARLLEDLARLLREQEDKVRDVSRIYESLLERMKDDIAGGRLTVSELKGRVTIAVQDQALFTGESGEIDPVGSSMLQKITAILKDLRESEIGIALPFEIPETAASGRAKGFNPAVLPAARATAVARFMRHNGIDSEKLIAMARGRFGPVFNSGAEPVTGKGSRIEITVTTRD